MSKSIQRPNNILDLGNITTYQSGVVQSAAFRSIKKHTDALLQTHGLTTMQWFVIGTVSDYGDGGVRITELALKVGTTLGFLTNSINLLESKGMLQRIEHESDSRSKLVSISPAYEHKIKIIEEDLRNKMRTSIYSKVSPEELRIYIKVLYQLANLS